MSLHEVFKMWPSILIGAGVGLLLVPLSDVGIDFARDSYDVRNPVVTANGTLLARTDDTVEIAIVGEKKRACIYVAVAAFGTGADALIRDLFVHRLDMPSTNATRPVGAQSFGVWRIWPTSKTTRVQIWVTHQCEGRLVRTLMADVDLPRSAPQ